MNPLTPLLREAERLQSLEGVRDEPAGAGDERAAQDAARTAAQAVRRRWYLPLLGLLLGMGAAVGSHAANPRYQAQTDLRFTGANAFVALGGPAPAPPTPNDILDDSVLASAARGLGLRVTPAALRRRIEVTPAPGGLLFTVRAEASTRPAALRLANAVSANFVRARNAVLAGGAARAVRNARAQLRTAPRRSRPALRRRIAQLAAARTALAPDTLVTQSATPVGATNPAVTTALAGLAGLLAGIALAVLLVLRQKRFPSALSAAAALGLPLLAELPRPSTGAAEAGSPASRMAALLLSREGGRAPDSALCTALSPGDRADHAARLVAEGLAHAEPGTRVELILWDEQAAEGGAPAPEAAQAPNLSVTAVTEAWAGVRARLDRLAQEGVVCVIGAPALLDAEDVLAATQAASQWLVCVDPSTARREHARALRAHLEEGLPQRPTGVVAVGLDAPPIRAG